MNEKHKISQVKSVWNGQTLPVDKTVSIYRTTPYQFEDTVDPLNEVKDSDIGYHYSDKVKVDQFTIRYND